MTIRSCLTLAILAIAVPIAVHAEMPNVTGIRANVDGGGRVTVSWNPVDGDIATYRIFYSHASILEQEGVYDDYEDAPGDAIQYTLTSVPPTETLYVSILAVGGDGSESALFQEEASVALDGRRVSATSTSAAALPPSPTVPMQSATLKLLTAASLSETSVLLTFTHSVSIPEQYREQAFTIKSGSGSPLRIMRYRLEDNRALLETERQIAGRVYQVMIHGSIAGHATDGRLVPQDAASAPLLFSGLGANASLKDVSNLTLVKNNNTVKASWTLPTGIFRELQIQQSTNGGRTFGTPIRIDRSMTSVSIPGVMGDTFTLLIRMVGTDGSLSRGVQQTVTIGGKVQTSSASTAASKPTQQAGASSRSMTTSSRPARTPKTLPSSGLGIVTVTVLSGAATGMRFVRRKNAGKRKT